jgi:putative ATPase
MRHQGYGRGYQYAHDVPEKVADMDCLPESLADRHYYQPTEEGFEQRLRARMEEIRRIRSPQNSGAQNSEGPENPKGPDTSKGRETSKKRHSGV